MLHCKLSKFFKYHNTSLTLFPPATVLSFSFLLQNTSTADQDTCLSQSTICIKNGNPLYPYFPRIYRAIKRTMLTRSCFHVVLTSDNPDRSQVCPDTLY